MNDSATTQQLTAFMPSVRSLAPEAYCKTLFDPTQTHAVYCIPVEQVDAVKALLKGSLGATRFRVVKPHVSYQRIICFKLK